MLGANVRVLNLLSYLGIEPATVENTIARSFHQSGNLYAANDKARQFISGLNELSLDSRETNASSIFIGISGRSQKGHDFLPQVAQNSCVLALLETQKIDEHNTVEIRQYEHNQAVVCIHIIALADELANIARAFYTNETSTQNWPQVTAVTGTNGKTSVASLVAQLSSLCNIKSASIGTLGINVYEQGQASAYAKTINTTPDVITLFSRLSQLAQVNCQLVCVEASSHGLAQNRLQNLPIQCAIFTNLSQDHLDYHQNMQAYAAAKRKLLEATDLSLLVLNADDKESLQWQQQAMPSLNVYWYSLHALMDTQQGCWASDIEYSTAGVSFTLHVSTHHERQQAKLHSPLIGPFNVSNLLAAVTALIAQGTDFSLLSAAAPSLRGVSGRMELFTSNNASILVDYAHTPDALKQALLAARVHTTGKLTCVFGCGGDRDISKREIMGAIAVQFADHIILTQDNSRTEAPMSIIQDIQKGIDATALRNKVEVELDRKQAITGAWQHSDQNDMILIAGKGHEDYIEMNGKRIDYNEREFVHAMINNKACVDTLNSKDFL